MLGTYALALAATDADQTPHCHEQQAGKQRQQDAGQLEKLLLQIVDQHILLVCQHSKLKKSNYDLAIQC